MDDDDHRPDHALVEQLRAGDETALGDLVAGWTPAMIRLARHYVPSREVAEEVVQDSWMAVVASIHGFEGRSSLRTWVHGIVVRRAQQTGARERRSLPFSAVWRDENAEAFPASSFHHRGLGPDSGGWISAPARWDSLADSSDRITDGDPVLAVVEAAIAALPTAQGQVITARDVWGCETAEVCVLLGITPNHQRVLLHRARAKVRAAVAASVLGEDPPSTDITRPHSPRPTRPTDLRES